MEVGERLRTFELLKLSVALAARNWIASGSAFATLMVTDIALDHEVEFGWGLIALEWAAYQMRDACLAVGLTLLLIYKSSRLRSGWDLRLFTRAILLEAILGAVLTLGSLLLIFPGLYLAARLSITLPLMLSEHGRIVDVMKESWRDTAADARPLFASVLACTLPLLLALTGLIAVVGLEDQAFFWTFSAGYSLSLILVWHLSVVIFSELRGERRLRKVFA